MLLLEKLAESKIKAAIDRGELDDLPGAGEPLILDDDSQVPDDLKAGYRILKNAGYLPPEILLMREISNVEALLCQIECDSTRSHLIVKLDLLRSQLAARKK